MTKQISNHLVKKAKKIMDTGDKRSEQNKRLREREKPHRTPSIRVDKQTYDGLVKLAARDRRTLSNFIYKELSNLVAENESRREDLVY